MIDPITLNEHAHARHQGFLDEAAQERRASGFPSQRPSLGTMMRRFAAPVLNVVRPSTVEETRSAAPVLADPCLEPCP